MAIKILVFWEWRLGQIFDISRLNPLIKIRFFVQKNSAMSTVNWWCSKPDLFAQDVGYRNDCDWMEACVYLLAALVCGSLKDLYLVIVYILHEFLLNGRMLQIFRVQLWSSWSQRSARVSSGRMWGPCRRPALRVQGSSWGSHLWHL